MEPGGGGLGIAGLVGSVPTYMRGVLHGLSIPRYLPCQGPILGSVDKFDRFGNSRKETGWPDDYVCSCTIHGHQQSASTLPGVLAFLFRQSASFGIALGCFCTVRESAGLRSLEFDRVLLHLALAGVANSFADGTVSILRGRGDACYEPVRLRRLDEAPLSHRGGE